MVGSFGGNLRFSTSDDPSQHATCRVFVASHIKGPAYDLAPGQYDLSHDVIQLDTEETFQGQTASFTLLPRRPYHEWIFPGDWVSIYLSSGANAPSGFGVDGDPEKANEDVRVFFGFIDAVRTSTTVSEKGDTKVRISVNCSGIQKAFDKTSLYFNAVLAGDSMFAARLPGLANLSRGLTLSGTPATIPRAIALAYLGFGGQFRIPDNYPGVLGNEQERKTRVDTTVERLRSIETAFGYNFLRESKAKIQEPGLLQNIWEKQKDKFQANSVAITVDFFSYVEDILVDGYIVSSPFHDVKGNLWALMQEYSNPVMNECFLTLLPANPLSPYRREETGGKDEWGMRPHYMPSLVIRERPFCWADRRTAASGAMRLGDKKLRFSLPSNRGNHFYEYAPTFFSSRSTPVESPVLQKIRTVGLSKYIVQNMKMDLFTPPKRFIDRVELQTKDIYAETLGLVDTDLVNFFMMSLSDIAISKQIQQYAMVTSGILPVYLTNSIKKFGLRVRESSSKFLAQGSTKIDGKSAMSIMIRTILAFDMWYQNLPWYRRGTISCRAVPKARVGMGLTVSGVGREESFYVEGVKHEFAHGETGAGRLRTTFTVTRGQPGALDVEKRFQYAPPDAVKIFVKKGTTLEKEAVEGEPVVATPETKKYTVAMFWADLDKFHLEKLVTDAEDDDVRLEFRFRTRGIEDGGLFEGYYWIIQGIAPGAMPHFYAERKKVEATGDKYEFDDLLLTLISLRTRQLLAQGQYDQILKEFKEASDAGREPETVNLQFEIAFNYLSANAYALLKKKKDDYEKPPAEVIPTAEEKRNSAETSYREVPRKDAAHQPKVSRSPYTSEAQKIEAMLGFLYSLRKEGAVDDSDFAFVDEYVEKEKGKGRKETSSLFLEAIKNSVQKDVYEFTKKFLEASSKERKLPPLVPLKEDREKASDPPWTMPELRGTMWDPVRRTKSKNKIELKR